MEKGIDHRLTKRDRALCTYLWNEGPKDTAEVRADVFRGGLRAIRRLALLEQGGYVVRAGNGQGSGSAGSFVRKPDLWDVTLKGVRLAANFSGVDPPEKWEPRMARPEPEESAP